MKIVSELYTTSVPSFSLLPGVIGKPFDYSISHTRNEDRPNTGNRSSSIGRESKFMLDQDWVNIEE